MRYTGFIHIFHKNIGNSWETNFHYMPKWYLYGYSEDRLIFSGNVNNFEKQLAIVTRQFVNHKIITEVYRDNHRMFSCYTRYSKGSK